MTLVTDADCFAHLNKAIRRNGTFNLLSEIL
jgi:hypothetical protein